MDYEEEDAAFPTKLSALMKRNVIVESGVPVISMCDSRKKWKSWSYSRGNIGPSKRNLYLWQSTQRPQLAHQ